jgi:uncharacterized membrane protein YheB (UPF0754 family)
MQTHNNTANTVAEQNALEERIGVNKSALTNITALAVILAGFLLPEPYGEIVRTMGFFALSGAVTNWLAIHMLFEKVPGLYGSGVVPNHFEDFKYGIRRLIMNQFFTEENMRKFLADTLDSFDQSIDDLDIEPALEAIEYDKAFDSFTAMILQSSFGGMLNMFGGPSVLESFREPFKEKIKDFIREQAGREDFRQALVSAVTGSTDASDAAGDATNEYIARIKVQVEQIVSSRLDELTPKMVKEIVKDMIAKHLGWLVVWGGVFGGAIGLLMGFLPV